MCEDERGYYWMVCNWKIARRELDVSGSQHNPNIREKRPVRFLLSILLGKPTLVRYFVERCPDFVTAGTLPELGGADEQVTGDGALAHGADGTRGRWLRRDDRARQAAVQ